MRNPLFSRLPSSNRPRDKLVTYYLWCYDKRIPELRQAEKQVVGRVRFASGEEIEYTDKAEYLQAVKEELPYQATTGFRCETLTDDPQVRKAVDDLLCDLYGEDNLRPLEDYRAQGPTMNMEM